MTASSDAALPAESKSNQTILVSIASIVVIAVTAFLLQWLSMPKELLAPLSTASGALVPAIAIRRNEKRRSKASQASELISGRLRREPVYVLFVASGALVAVEFASFLLAIVIAYISLSDAQFAGLISEEQLSEILLSEQSASVGLAALLTYVALTIASAAVGVYVAHRIAKGSVYWALGAVVLGQVVTVLVALATGSSWSDIAASTFTWQFAVLFALLATAVTLGALRGRRTRALFSATRLFRRLSEDDRRTILSLMDEAQVASRLRG